MKHDLSEIIRRTRASFPGGKPTTARDALLLLDATRQAATRTRKHVLGLDIKALGSDEPQRQKRALLRTLSRLGVRLDRYAEALAHVNPGEPPPPEAAPLLRNILWTSETPLSRRHFTPDFATPFTVDNQAGALSDYIRSQKDSFFEDLKISMREVVVDVVDAIDDPTSAVTRSPWHWAIGIGAIACAGGFITYKLTR